MTHAYVVKARLEAWQVQGSHVLVGDDRGARTGHTHSDSHTGPIDHAVAYDDVVATLAEVDPNGRHPGLVHAAAPSWADRCSPSASITSAAITSLRSSRVSTVTSAVA